MHAVAIRLQEGGFGAGVIAVALGTEPDRIPPLLKIAGAKLARLLAADDTINLASSPCHHTDTTDGRDTADDGCP